MDNIKIRLATNSESDINGIVKVYKAGDGVPWSKFDECNAWISKRLERGFYIQLAEVDDKIVAHGEWIISDEPDRRFVYLGMLEVNEAYQKMGIGRRMISDGIEYAKRNNCKLAITNPDTETGADIFYRKCGFINGRKHFSLKMLTEKYKNFEFTRTHVDKVPFAAIKEKRYVFGKGQFCSRHMWEVYNEKPVTDDRLSPAIQLPDGSYIQLGYWISGDGGYLMIWSNSSNYSDIIKSALSFGYSLELHHVDFDYLEDEEKHLDGFDVYDKKQEADFEQIFYIN